MNYPKSNLLNVADGHSDSDAAEMPADARQEKTKEGLGQNLDLRGQAYIEYNYLQQTGMTTLNGLVVHGAACASLLALGNMAAVGLETSHEILTAPTTPIIPQPDSFVVKSMNAESVPAVKQENHSASHADVLMQPSELSSLIESPVPILLSHEHPLVENADKFIDLTPEMMSAISLNDIQQSAHTYTEYVSEFRIDIRDKNGKSVLDTTTDDNQPILAGNAQPFSLIEVFNHDGKLVATTAVDNQGQWRINFPQTLPDGQYEFTLYNTDPTDNNTLGTNKIRLEISTENAINIEAEPPLFSVIPMNENGDLVNLTRIFTTVEPVKIKPVNIDLSELIYNDANELFMVSPDSLYLEELNTSDLDILQISEGGILNWVESDASLQNGSEYNLKDVMLDLNIIVPNPYDTDY
ncbi:hypothetical protein HX773_21305 [Pantoea sp. B9002]|uniref:Ig-like domain-containing protein n=1 Tax=Pantoea sp. B9002 TaxID=2726979 RepID=UPI00159FA0F8|nr:Ig-like domain-containing protein [Pantoea sp. B9002]NWA63446.1 hypothetical protein [Pantoea sp. B9002]